MGRYHDREGREITVSEWSRLFEDMRYRRIARIQVGDVSISTVWMGLNHAFIVGDELAIFETMVFGGDLDGEMDRYATEKEAIAGHRSMVARVKEAASVGSSRSGEE